MTDFGEAPPPNSSMFGDNQGDSFRDPNNISAYGGASSKVQMSSRPPGLDFSWTSNNPNNINNSTSNNYHPQYQKQNSENNNNNNANQADISNSYHQKFNYHNNNNLLATAESQNHELFSPDNVEVAIRDYEKALSAAKTGKKS